MRRKQKELVEPRLEPWNQEQSITLQLPEMRIQNIFNPEITIPQLQYKRDLLISPQLHHICKQSPNIQKTNVVKRQSPKTVPVKKSSQIDFMKRNQESIKSYYLNQANYRTVLNDEHEYFTPLNGKQHMSYVVKRPTINTTYISYFQQKSPVVDSPIKSRVRRNTFRRQSLDCKTRPRTSDSVSFYENFQQQRVRMEDLELMGRTTIAVGSSHLQKVLKIKEKLRQKLRKNSQKKDFKAGFYVKNVMRIQEERCQEQNAKNLNNEEVLVIRKQKSCKKIESKDKMGVDKWKQYLKLKNEEQARRKISGGENKISKPFLGVMGGSIYR